MLVSAFLMAAALVGGDQDGVVATAPATQVDLQAVAEPAAPSVSGAAQTAVPHGLSTDQQIERWIAARAPEVEPYADRRTMIEDDGQMHGEFNFGIGTGGYRDYGAAVSLPLGEHGRLHLSYRQVENGYYPYGYGYGYGYPYGYGGARHGGPAFLDGGYAFPGAMPPDAALDYESRLRRPGGPPWVQPAAQPDRASE
jgi:hypothetical protein